MSYQHKNDSTNLNGAERIRVTQTRKNLHFCDRSADWYEQESKELIADSLRTVEQTKEVANKASQHLNSQTEQLQRIQRDVNEVSYNLDTSEYLIKGMKSWWGSFVQLFTSPTEQRKPVSSINSVNPVDSDHLKSPNSNKIYNESPTTGVETFQKLQQEKVAPVDENLNQLSEVLAELHVKAVEMGNTISTHNTSLDSIQECVNKNTSRMHTQKKDIEKLIKR